MADNKDSSSFFRKVVKFVANPATDWAQLGAPTEDARESEYAKSELKAMIERKRRNDFVRKREFDMLRKVRREGLTSEQLATLGGSSRIDDSEARMPESGAKPYSGVKAKIDEIEQQMVGDGLASPSRRTPSFYDAPTQPAAIGYAATQPDSSLSRGAPPAPAAVVMSPGLSPLNGSAESSELGRPFAAEVSEVEHDPELDEAVIAFANADFELCEESLASLTSSAGPRAQHAETWLALFDLYRAIGQQQKFESLALDYAQQFGWSAPQWFSMPRLVAEAASEERRPSNARIDGNVGWVCPTQVEADTVAELRSQTLQMPLPWVFDWSALQSIDAEGCARLSELFRSWMGQSIDMRWVGGERLLQVLQDTAPAGVRDADPVFWQVRLDALRLANRPDQFDEAAIDYCVTYEVSPPSWEPVTCQVRISGSNLSTQSPPLSVVSDVSTSFQESQLIDEPGVVQVAGVELSGQLVGDISATLAKMHDDLGSATIVNVSCARLIRVDFIAAGDLLNWVLARRSENRSVSFSDAHRLVALFFGAMGINEHAKVKVRIV
jgi:ABC-type transporter Mla MlaB component